MLNSVGWDVSSVKRFVLKKLCSNVLQVEPAELFVFAVCVGTDIMRFAI